MSYFAPYYQNTLEKKKGFKLVLGGTGLGKTSGIIETIKQNPSEKKRFFYLANRLQLLNELKADLEKENIGYCLQKSNGETLKDIGLNEFSFFLENPILKKYADNIFKNKKITKSYILSRIKFIKRNLEHSSEAEGEILRLEISRVFSYFKRIISYANRVHQIKKYIATYNRFGFQVTDYEVLKTIFVSCSINIKDIIKNKLLELPKELLENDLFQSYVKYVQKKKPRATKIGRNILEIAKHVQKCFKQNEQFDKYNFLVTDFSELIEQELVQIIFPYISFQQNPTKKRIFIVSLQKAFYGFFNGKTTINLHRLENNKQAKEQNVIFLDEFDFLENDLLSQLCKDISIKQPFSFVDFFYTTLTKYKLPRINFLKNHKEIRKRLQEEIITQVESLSKKYKIPFPKINHFLCQDNSLKNMTVFQTRYSISHKNIYLNSCKKDESDKKINSFFLEETKDEKTANAYILLNVVNQTTAAIIRIIKDLEIDEPEVAVALIEHCFSAADTYKSILKRICQHPYQRKLVTTNLSKLYYNGFGLYEIYNFHYPTDENEVVLKYYSLFSTPESILLSLTKNNLVFGLSATAEINRLLKNFDLNWLKQELGKSYYQASTEDKKLIKKANEVKFSGSERNEGRNNKISVEIAENSLSTKMSGLIKNEVQVEEEIFGQGSQKEYRTKRVEHFFVTLEWVNNQPNTSTNLLFFSSYKQILYFFQKVQKPVTKVYSIEKIDNNLSQCYSISYENQNYIVLFLDAAQGKEIAQFEKHKEDYYKLFRANKPVIVVTTYASAGNGVNLFYYADEAKTQKKDFNNIHLLDSPYYYFNKIEPNDTEQEQREKIKANIYHLAKLEKAKIISEAQFKTYLNNIRNIDTINGSYHKTADALYNKVATYIQAIGRIERSWNKAEDQVIRLEREVYNVLEDFCKVDNGEAKRNRQKYLKNLPYYSWNVAQMFEQIIVKKTERNLQISHYQEESLQEINNRCKRKIKKLVELLELVRQNKLPKKRLDEIRKEWNTLRKVALGQNYTKATRKLLRKYSCIFDTNYYDYENKSLFIQNNTLNIVPRSLLPDSSFYEWKLDKIYQNVINHPVVREHFDYNRFEYGFLGGNPLFTPYFYQCILAGAIGEEAVKAIFHKESILLSEQEIDNTLFELTDLKISGKPWYIDAKNYSEQTIQHFQILDKTDHFYHPKLNEEYFKPKAIEKWQKIKMFHQDANAKLIYINAFSNIERPIQFFDENFNVISGNFIDAKIIVVPSMIKKGKAEKGKGKHYVKGFPTFLSQIKKQLQND